MVTLATNTTSTETFKVVVTDIKFSLVPMEAGTRIHTGVAGAAERG